MPLSVQDVFTLHLWNIGEFEKGSPEGEVIDQIRSLDPAVVAHPILKNPDQRRALFQKVSPFHVIATITWQPGIRDQCKTLIELLKKEGFDINEPDAYTWSPLCYAAWFGQAPMVDVFLEMGAHADPVEKGCSPLASALSQTDKGVRKVWVRDEDMVVNHPAKRVLDAAKNFSDAMDEHLERARGIQKGKGGDFLDGKPTDSPGSAQIAAQNTISQHGKTGVGATAAQKTDVTPQRPHSLKNAAKSGQEPFVTSGAPVPSTWMPYTLWSALENDSFASQADLVKQWMNDTLNNQRVGSMLNRPPTYRDEPLGRLALRWECEDPSFSGPHATCARLLLRAGSSVGKIGPHTGSAMDFGATWLGWALERQHFRWASLLWCHGARLSHQDHMTINVQGNLGAMMWCVLRDTSWQEWVSRKCRGMKTLRWMQSHIDRAHFTLVDKDEPSLYSLQGSWMDVDLWSRKWVWPDASASKTGPRYSENPDNHGKDFRKL